MPTTTLDFILGCWIFDVRFHVREADNVSLRRSKFLFLLLFLTLSIYFTLRVHLLMDETTSLGVLGGKGQRKTSTDIWQYQEM